jgi:DNA-binding SARP family transcriptional activator
VASVEDVPSAPVDPPAHVALTLLDEFELRVDGHTVDLCIPGQRLLAYLALRGHPVRRASVAGTLWIDASENRASGSLRSAMWRLGGEREDLLRVTATHVGLSPEVAVDLHVAFAMARSLSDTARPLDVDEGLAGLLMKDLLPDWYDEWLFIERERFRQIRLHALEILCERLTAGRNYTLAIETGLAAVAIEPLRESAHRILIKAHLAEGNRSEAVRQYRLLCDLLRKELNVDPPEEVTRLVRSALPRTPATSARTG